MILETLLQESMAANKIATRRRIIHIQKQKNRQRITKNKNNSFKEEAKRLNEELRNLLNQDNSIDEIKFLRRVAITVKQLHFDAKKAKKCQKLSRVAEKVEQFLCTPWGDENASFITLLQAADAYSEQDPKHSDLVEVLSHLKQCGPQLLAPLALID